MLKPPIFTTGTSFDSEEEITPALPTSIKLNNICQNECLLGPHVQKSHQLFDDPRNHTSCVISNTNTCNSNVANSNISSNSQIHKDAVIVGLWTLLWIRFLRAFCLVKLHNAVIESSCMSRIFPKLKDRRKICDSVTYGISHYLEGHDETTVNCAIRFELYIRNYAKYYWLLAIVLCFIPFFYYCLLVVYIIQKSDSSDGIKVGFHYLALFHGFFGSYWWIWVFTYLFVTGLYMVFVEVTGESMDQVYDLWQKQLLASNNYSTISSVSSLLTNTSTLQSNTNAASSSSSSKPISTPKPKEEHVTLYSECCDLYSKIEMEFNTTQAKNKGFHPYLLKKRAFKRILIMAFGIFTSTFLSFQNHFNLLQHYLGHDHNKNQYTYSSSENNDDPTSNSYAKTQHIFIFVIQILFSAILVMFFFMECWQWLIALAYDKSIINPGAQSLPGELVYLLYYFKVYQKTHPKQNRSSKPKSQIY